MLNFTQAEQKILNENKEVLKNNDWQRFANNCTFVKKVYRDLWRKLAIIFMEKYNINICDQLTFYPSYIFDGFYGSEFYVPETVTEIDVLAFGESDIEILVIEGSPRIKCPLFGAGSEPPLTTVFKKDCQIDGVLTHYSDHIEKIEVYRPKDSQVQKYFSENYSTKCNIHDIAEWKQ